MEPGIGSLYGGYAAPVQARRNSRVAPVEFRDAAEMFARQHGGHGDVVWVPDPINCWSVRFTLKHGDPRLRNPNDGEHFESILLHEWVDPKIEPNHPKVGQLPRNGSGQRVPAYLRIELDEVGVSGLVEILQKGSLLSGRGEFKSAEAAAQHSMRKHREMREKTHRDLREQAGLRAVDVRRTVEGIPYHRVGIDLTTQDKASHHES